MVYTKEEKLRVVKLYLEQGIVEYPINATTQMKCNIRKKVKKWVGVYKEKGEEGLAPQTRSFTFAQKKQAVERVLNGESKYHVAFTMGTTDTKEIRKWVRQYNESGWSGIKDGNAKKYFNIKKSKSERIKELEKIILDLQENNKKLTAEVKYLKKLIALVQGRE